MEVPGITQTTEEEGQSHKTLATNTSAQLPEAVLPAKEEKEFLEDYPVTSEGDHWTEEKQLPAGVRKSSWGRRWGWGSQRATSM